MVVEGENVTGVEGEREGGEGVCEVEEGGADEGLEDLGNEGKAELTSPWCWKQIISYLILRPIPKPLNQSPRNTPSPRIHPKMNQQRIHRLFVNPRNELELRLLLPLGLLRSEVGGGEVGEDGVWGRFDVEETVLAKAMYVINDE